ncbi:M24 family metallopeptidase [Halocatena marina]|uniref:M24 family metallopeptidase n=1 Tax=Halocatena marina TaxID=2934937 RepID=UPI00200D80A9|nr:Xaa-Pro peptidase family protein [Halocatena marina]
MRSHTIPNEELRDRQQRLLDKAHDRGFAGIVLFRALNIQYLTGMSHQQTERPCALGLTDEARQIVVPRLERDHADADRFEYDTVRTYFDYPQSEPMMAVRELCKDLEIASSSVLADTDGSPARYGYEGPPLSEIISGCVHTEDIVTSMREVKSGTEIELVAEASRWGDFAQRRLQEKLTQGRRPITIAYEVEGETTAAMLDTLGTKYEMKNTHPVRCMFTAGPTTAEPHSVNGAPPIEDGDTIVTIITPTVSGYTAELERTLFVGEPDANQRHYFEIMRESQQIAFDTVAPGVEYATVEEAVMDYYDENGVRKYTQCHVGHNIGLESHERPYLDRGYEGRIREGELFTIEPGLYVPELGGFRHSDTIAVTSDGCTSLTSYPRDIESLTVTTN